MHVTRRELFELAGLALVVRADDALDATAGRAAGVIRGYDSEGFHRTATPVDRASADRLVSLARAAGARPRLQPFELSRVDPAASFVEIAGRRIEGLPMFDASFTGPDGVQGAIGAVNGDRAIAWTAINPNGEVELRKSRDGSPHRALIAVTTGQHPGLCPVNAASFTEPFGPPVLQISSEHRPLIERAVAAGVEVRVVAAATRRQTTAFNVAAEVAGRQPELPPVCVMTPRSGWYSNASERGGRLVCWLETLRACAAAKPLRSVRFVASSGHELGHLGLHGYLAANATLAREALLWVHYGANIGASTGDVGMICSADRFESVSLRALAKYDLVPAGYGPDGVRRASARVAGEAATIAREGGHFVSFIGQNAWFHNARDVWPDAVDVNKVARFARATADLTLALANTPS
jgi:hypothetical protein